MQVYRLITRNTYEREMFDRASLKLGLDKAVLQSMGSKELAGVSTENELLTVLMATVIIASSDSCRL